MLFARALVLLSLWFAVPGQPQSTHPDPFAPLAVFVGAWRGEQSGEPGKGVSERKYEFILGGRFLQVSNTSTYPPQDRNTKGEVHHDLGMISYDRARKKLVFRQFHSEGFVNTYVQEPGSDPKRLVFTSEAIENIPAGWRAREIYTILNENELVERFELAAQGEGFRALLGSPPQARRGAFTGVGRGIIARAVVCPRPIRTASLSSASLGD